MARTDPVIEMLAGVDLFEDLSKPELSRIAQAGKLMRFEPGDTITVEGEEGGRFYLVLEGKAKVTVAGRTRGTLGRGDSFGEISLIDGGPRSATVTVEEPMETLSLAEFNFRPLLKSNPTIAYKLLVVLTRRLRNVERTLLH